MKVLYEGQDNEVPVPAEEEENEVYGRPKYQTINDKEIQVLSYSKGFYIYLHDMFQDQYNDQEEVF